MRRQIAPTNRAIHPQVYALYGLTAEEIAVVEGLSASGRTMAKANLTRLEDDESAG